MIIQGLLDWLSVVLAGWIDLIPDLPASLSSAINSMESSAATVGSLAAKFGVIIPFDALTACLAGWVALMSYWGSVLLFRLVLFVIGR